MRKTEASRFRGDSLYQVAATISWGTHRGAARCQAAVHDTYGVGFHQCHNRAKPGTEWCGIHSPEAIQKRQTKLDDRLQAEREKSAKQFQRYRDERQALELLVSITDRWNEGLVVGPNCEFADDLRAIAERHVERTKPNGA